MDNQSDSIVVQENFDTLYTNDIGTCAPNSTVPCRHATTIDLKDKRQLAKFLKGMWNTIPISYDETVRVFS